MSIDLYVLVCAIVLLNVVYSLINSIKTPLEELFLF